MDSFRGAKIMAVTIFLICGTISTFGKLNVTKPIS